VLELPPYRKFLYSPDAFGLPELTTWVPRSSVAPCPASSPPTSRKNLYTERTVARLTGMLCAEYARRAYRLGDQG
jgi:hypothetical protein